MSRLLRMASALVMLLSLLIAVGGPAHAAPANPINHVIVIYQENWSFDSLYGNFPGANGVAKAGAAIKQVDKNNQLLTALPQPIDTNLKPAAPDSRFPANMPVQPFAIEGIEGEGDRAVNRLITTLCSGNLPTGTAPGVLGIPRPPLGGASDREERSTNADRIISRGLAIVGIGGLCIVAVAVIGVGLLWRPGRAR